jgi:predicted PhzF superfamily epimerase YddE/YHI9
MRCWRYPDKADAALLRQECGIGMVPAAVTHTPRGKLLTMTQAAPSYRDAGLARAVGAEMLGSDAADLAPLPFEVVSTGVPWLIVAVRGDIGPQSRPGPDRACAKRRGRPA